MSAAHGGYYLPDPTKWPTITSMGLFLLALGFILNLHYLAPGVWLMMAGAGVIVLMMFAWFSTGPSWYPSKMWIGSHGKFTEIGAVLTEEDRLKTAKQLRSLLRA